jgi:hypothetical protein
MIEMEVFATARKVVDALRKHSCAEALQWCQENRVRLKRIQVRIRCRLHSCVCETALVPVPVLVEDAGTGLVSVFYR